MERWNFLYVLVCFEIFHLFIIRELLNKFFYQIKYFHSLKHSKIRGGLIVCSKNTRHRGKYHCKADLLFDWFGFSQTSKSDANSIIDILIQYKQSKAVGSKQNKEEVSHIVILPFKLVFSGLLFWAKFESWGQTLCFFWKNAPWKDSKIQKDAGIFKTTILAFSIVHYALSKTTSICFSFLASSI